MMEGAKEELERRSKFLSSLIEKQKKKAAAAAAAGHKDKQKQVNNNINIRVRASDMAIGMQKNAFNCYTDYLHSIPPPPPANGNGNHVKKLIDNKRLALALKKKFDCLYGPAWHCIVGTSFGSYVTHSSGCFLYFSIDKVHVLLFKTAVDPIKIKH